MKWLLAVLVFLAAVTFLIVGLGKRQTAVRAVGSTSIQPFAEMLAETFNRDHPDNQVDVQGGGSAAGLQAARTGIADIGMCSRALKPDEKFDFVIIAHDGLAIIVHPSNPLRGLTHDQIRNLFAGRITNWSELSTPACPLPHLTIHLITREEGSGTREAFTKLIMGEEDIAPMALTQESNGAVKELVRNDPAAIGYMSLGLVGGELMAIQVDGVEPTVAEVKAGRYPLVRPFLFVWSTKPSPKAQRYIDFVCSPEGQRMLEREGLVGER
jgi:phosphate transport system substrate-binding protein